MGTTGRDVRDGSFPLSLFVCVGALMMMMTKAAGMSLMDLQQCDAPSEMGNRRTQRRRGSRRREEKALIGLTYEGNGRCDRR